MLTGALREEATVPRLGLRPAQSTALLEGIAGDFAARVAIDQPGFTANGLFFPARGRFDILRTCNAWLGAALRRTAVPVRGVDADALCRDPVTVAAGTLTVPIAV